MLVRFVFLHQMLLAPALQTVQTMMAVVVDCGSGHSSAKCFSTDAGGGTVILVSEYEHLPILVEAIKPGGELGAASWCAALAEHVPAATPISIAATAGIRMALDEKVISPADIETLHAALAEQFGPRATFRVLSGQEEAEMEHTACTACFAWATTASPCPPPDAGRVLLASAGGVSMQASAPTKMGTAARGV